MQSDTSAQLSESVVATSYLNPALVPRYHIFSVAQFSQRNPIYTQPALRNLIFKAESRKSSRGEILGNGLLECGAILRVGSKVLIDEDKFFGWVRQQNRSTSISDRNAPQVTADSSVPRQARRNRGSPRPVCQQCNGSGTDPSTSDQCVRCSGSGYEPLDD